MFFGPWCYRLAGQALLLLHMVVFRLNRLVWISGSAIFPHSFMQQVRHCNRGLFENLRPIKAPTLEVSDKTQHVGNKWFERCGAEHGHTQSINFNSSVLYLVERYKQTLRTSGCRWTPLKIETCTETWSSKASDNWVFTAANGFFIQSSPMIVFYLRKTSP